MATSQNAADIISLPSGGGALSGLGESFAPDLHTGTGNLTVPIVVPPGRNGFAPALQLAYSTGNGNGPMGLGWTLGLPMIARKTARGVPRYSNDDIFLLAGAEDLVPMRTVGPTTFYRPRTEGLFARIACVRKNAGMHWEVQTRDGLVHMYGARTTPAIQTPALDATAQVREGQRVYAWYLAETRDTFGNRIEYRYLPDEPSDAVARARDEANGHVFNGVVLDSVRYVDYEDAGTRRFLISISLEYDDRPDLFSDIRAGFEIRSARRCRGLTISTHADAAAEQQVRTYELTYLDELPAGAGAGATPSNGVSLLSRIEVFGYEDNGPGATGQVVRELPPLALKYSAFRPDKRTLTAIGGSELPPRSLAAQEYRLVDLSGDGLPDVLELDDVARYWRNRGGWFDPPRRMRSAPAGAGLANRGTQLLDANGDGRADLVVSEYRGYFPVGFDVEWDDRALRRYSVFPSFPLDDLDVRLVDLDGDGLTDVLRAATSFECYFNAVEPDRAWRRSRRLSRKGLDTFPDVSLSDERVRIVDMNGDTLQDIMLIHEEAICYWPNRGHGDWGPRVWMDDCPRLPFEYDPVRLLVGDVDGDGLADLVYIGESEVTLWVNRNGDSWSEPLVVQGTPSPVGAHITLADVNGSGIAGVLWTRDFDGRRQTIEFLDFTGGAKPYLLEEVDNGIGAVTRIEYRPSTWDYLEDEKRLPARWRTRLPFPVHVVGRVNTDDRISESSLSTEYRYHHGYWDGYEREFRGFGRVDQRDLSSSRSTAPGEASMRTHPPPLETRTWFDVGPVVLPDGGWEACDLSHEFSEGSEPFFSESPETAAFLSSLERHSQRSARRSLRGSVLRTELYSLDGSPLEGVPYTVTEFSYGISGVIEDASGECNLVEGRVVGPEPNVFFPHTFATRTTNWERGEDPMISMQFFDGYDAFGRVRDEISIDLPRRSAKRVTIEAAVVGKLQPDERVILARCTRKFYAEPDVSAYPDLYLHDRVSHEVSFEPLHGREPVEQDPDDLGHVISDYLLAARMTVTELLTSLGGWRVGDPMPKGVRLVGHTRNRYDGAPFVGRADGRLGPRGALVRREVLAFTNAELQTAYITRRPSYLGGNQSLPAGAPNGFGTGLGYRLRTSSPGAYFAGWYVEVERRELDALGLVVAARDPLGGMTQFEFDRFSFLAVKAKDPIGLESSATNNYRVLKPDLIVDVNGNATALSYSPLGLVRARWIEGREGEGGTSQKPELHFEYDFGAYARTRGSLTSQPINVRTTRRLRHASEKVSDEVFVTCEYSDGFGRLVQTRVQAEDDGLDSHGLPPEFSTPPAEAVAGTSPARVVVSAWQKYDEKGRAIEVYEPFFSTGWDYQPESEAKQGQSTLTEYDPRGRITHIVSADGTERREVFGVPATLSSPDELSGTPWEIYTWDPNDLDGSRTAAYIAPTTGRAPTRHHATPSSRVLDGRGRIVCEVIRNGPDPMTDWFATRTVYDGAGNIAMVIDPLGRVAVANVYDLHNRLLRLESIDAGVRTAVLDAVGSLIESRDDRGSLVLREYDKLGRAVRVWARDASSQALTLRERLSYGDGGNPNQASATRQARRQRNLLGRLLVHRDEAGLVEFARYDFKGNPISKLRRVLSDTAIGQSSGVDWSQPGSTALLDPIEYETTSEWDALGRQLKIILPLEARARAGASSAGRGEISYRYDRAGALTEITLDGTIFVDRIVYDERGRRLFIAYGNGVMTRYAYDPKSFRVARVRTERFSVTSTGWSGWGGPLEDMVYTYDPAGNLVEIDERTRSCGVAGTPHGRNRLVRKFSYDPSYRLESATGRACRTPGGSSIADAIVCGSYSASHVPGPPTPNQDNAPNLTENYTESYEYDSVGNMLGITRKTGSQRWTRKYGFGGQTQAGWQHAPNNRLTSLRQGSTRHSYALDPNGCLEGRNSDRFYGWDHADRLVNYNVQAGGRASLKARYLYSPRGTQVKKWVQRGVSPVAETTVYIDDLFEFHRWREGGTTKVNNYLHVGDGRDRIAIVRVGDTSSRDAGPAVQYHLSDHVGSSHLVLRDDAGWINKEEYSPYGQTLFGSFGAKRYRFAAKELEDESGLCDFGARRYATWLGRFISCDPVAVEPAAEPRRNFAGGAPPATKITNPYSYVKNNPLRFVDRTGLSDDDGIEEARKARGYLANNTRAGMEQIAPVAEALVGLNPGIGVFEGLTGEAAIPGQEKLSTMDRIMSVPGVGKVFGLVLGVVGSAIVAKKATKLEDAVNGTAHVAAAGTRARAFNTLFMEKQRLKIWEDKSHPLKKLLDPTTGEWLGRRHGMEDAVAVQAGHGTSRFSGAPERLFLEDADFNQSTNWWGEVKKFVFNKPGVEIGGVPVERRTAEMWERTGILPPGFSVKDVPQHHGWAPLD